MSVDRSPDSAYSITMNRCPAHRSLCLGDLFSDRNAYFITMDRCPAQVRLSSDGDAYFITKNRCPAQVRFAVTCRFVKEMS
jgi:hypothetical protein